MTVNVCDVIYYEICLDIFYYIFNKVLLIEYLDLI